jgi:hypothetical protein
VLASNNVKAKAATALTAGLAVRAWMLAPSRFGVVRQPEAGQRHAREADAEFLQCRTARDRLGEALGKFIELVGHRFLLLGLLLIN